jgi:hypothetical protein
MVYFHNQKANFGIFWKALGCKLLVYFIAIFGTFKSHLVFLWPFWYFFHPFGLLHQEKSGNLARTEPASSVHFYLSD